jgi:hypothetical protein
VWEGTGAYAEARGFCELWGMEGTVLVDEKGELAERLGVRGVPANVFVDSDGTVTAVGGSTPAGLEAAARKLLGPGALAGFESPAGAADSDHAQIERHVTSWESRTGTAPDGPGGTPLA